MPGIDGTIVKSVVLVTDVGDAHEMLMGRSDCDRYSLVDADADQNMGVQVSSSQLKSFSMISDLKAMTLDVIVTFHFGANFQDSP